MGRADGLVDVIRIRSNALSDADRAFYAANHLRGCVMRGGFHPYFDLAPKDEVRLASRVFQERGALEVAALVDRAESLLFPDGLPDDFSVQCATLPSWSDGEIEAGVEPPWSRELDEVNGAFYALASTVDDVVFILARLDDRAG